MLESEASEREERPFFEASKAGSGVRPNYAESFTRKPPPAPEIHRRTFFISAEGGHLHWIEDRARALKLATREDANQLCEIVEDAEHIREVRL